MFKFKSGWQTFWQFLVTIVIVVQIFATEYIEGALWIIIALLYYISEDIRWYVTEGPGGQKDFKINLNQK